MTVTTPIKEDAIQDQILQAAKRLFQVHGLYKVTMDDVAKAIGKGRSSLYYYYKSKDEIFDAVMQLEIGDLVGAIAVAVNSVETVEQKINAFCVAKLNILRERRGFYNTLDAGMDADAMSDFNKTKVIHHGLIMQKEGALLKQILNYGIERGELKPVAEQDKKELVFVLLSGVHGIKREMIIDNNFENIESVVKTFTRVIMNGIKK
ncbi:TetR/AcrR family transcriptional regulator [Mucilaginibacter corticis]|uniref:TetR/AcrR family transcriptional regulator n=1 Tax=Mucilaginibacter corticis TaxID=2597670 RepID=A0A556MSB7_9SPHI|nr:TetR/AcrR family transcriptional regulator [Mucilaginibacter corticis]TSJ42722.1 TetR/AcrR family transcriptional regulator [Mucilaginibacter corticis]